MLYSDPLQKKLLVHSSATNISITNISVTTNISSITTDTLYCHCEASSVTIAMYDDI